MDVSAICRYMSAISRCPLDRDVRQMEVSTSWRYPLYGGVRYMGVRYMDVSAIWRCP